MARTVELTVNGRKHELVVEDAELLVDVIRDRLGLTGTKKSCETGECGCCTVLLDGQAVNSCMVLTVEVDGHAVDTVEGLERDHQLHPLQTAFIENSAIQCGFCTPGMLMSAKALLDSNSKPTEDEVRRAITGNYCRCTGYVRPVKAILEAARTSPAGAPTGSKAAKGGTR